jgi:hypothetical protein
MPLLPSCPASYIVLKATAFYVRIGYGICVDRQTSRRDAQARPNTARVLRPIACMHSWRSTVAPSSTSKPGGGQW